METRAGRCGLGEFTQLWSTEVTEDALPSVTWKGLNQTRTYLQPEADEPQSDFGTDFKARILVHQRLELLSQPHMLESEGRVTERLASAGRSSAPGPPSAMGAPSAIVPSVHVTHSH